MTSEPMTTRSALDGISATELLDAVALAIYEVKAGEGFDRRDLTSDERAAAIQAARIVALRWDRERAAHAREVAGLRAEIERLQKPDALGYEGEMCEPTDDLSLFSDNLDLYEIQEVYGIRECGRWFIVALPDVTDPDCRDVEYFRTREEADAAVAEARAALATPEAT